MHRPGWAEGVCEERETKPACIAGNPEGIHPPASEGRELHLVLPRKWDDELIRN